MLEGINTEDSNRLKIDLLNPSIDVVVCLTFTSLKYEDPDLSTLKKFLESDEFKELDVGMKPRSNRLASVRKWFNDPDVSSKMRENLSLFRSFSEANKDEKRYRFIISAISDPSNPGSSIYLYESGKLTDTQFQPVSKPPPPEVKKVLERSVTLKLQESPTAETVRFRVEYQQVKADSGTEKKWIIINTAEEVFNLTGLEFGKQYLIRYRIVGKVGVSEASDTIGPIPSSVTDPKTRREFLQYSQLFTLDLNTVNKGLRLSEGNRVITNTHPKLQPYPDHPDRFDYYAQVLCRESVSGRSYWEIEGSCGGVSIAVSYKSIKRKVYECGFGRNDQSWTLECSSSNYLTRHNDILTDLHVKSISSRVGVYVDHSAGTLSFYSVSGDTMSLIHTVQTTFTQPLYPGVWVGTGSSAKLLMNQNSL